MPDISMCPGLDCPNKNDCYRFKALPSKYMQSYFAVPPHTLKVEEDGVTTKWECNYYWEFKKPST